jgi:hypothetical protein
LTSRFSVLLSTALMCGICHAGDSIRLERDDAAGQLAVFLEGAKAFAYQYGEGIDIPYFGPILSPSGKSLTLQYPPQERFPHHRSLWIVDGVQLAGHRSIDFYHSWKNQEKPHDPKSPFQHAIRHVEFTKTEVEDGLAEFGMMQIWEIDRSIAVLDQETNVRVQPLGGGQYLFDLSFRLLASYGDVKFVTDKVHYAWPYVRLHPQFSGEKGGMLTNDRGHTTQQGTDNQFATWIDYSNTVDGTTEGLAVLSHPSNGKHKWLTREYGTFGPRRKEELSGTRFTLQRGESIAGRFGILVHTGDVETGRVAQRYIQYLEFSDDEN